MRESQQLSYEHGFRVGFKSAYATGGVSLNDHEIIYLSRFKTFSLLCNFFVTG